MTSVKALVAMVALLTQGTVAPRLSGQWTLASSVRRSAARGEEPSTRYVAQGWAVNCGRSCQMVLKGSTLTVENAQLEEKPSAPSPTVTIELDGRPHKVVDSVNRGESLEVTGRLEGGSVSVTTMVAGRPVSQTISLDKTQLVVASSGAAATFVFRYDRKQ